jgi:hypothetical protein
VKGHRTNSQHLFVSNVGVLKADAQVKETIVVAKAHKQDVDFKRVSRFLSRLVTDPTHIYTHKHNLQLLDD